MLANGLEEGKVAEMNLTLEETHEAQRLINLKKCGIYELKEIYGAHWEKVFNRTFFGKKFKTSVAGNFLKNIRLMDKKSNNHWIYEIYSE